MNITKVSREDMRLFEWIQDYDYDNMITTFYILHPRAKFLKVARTLLHFHFVSSPDWSKLTPPEVINKIANFLVIKKIITLTREVA